MTGSRRSRPFRTSCGRRRWPSSAPRGGPAPSAPRCSPTCARPGSRARFTSSIPRRTRSADCPPTAASARCPGRSTSRSSPSRRRPCRCSRASAAPPASARWSCSRPGSPRWARDGAELQAELLEACRASGMRLVGPNCLGVLNTAPGVRLNATFAPEPPRPGRIAFASQSGAFGIAAIAEAARRGLGLSSFVSTGDKADLSGNDFLRFWEQDDDTDVVLLYLESFGNPRRFGRIARAVAARKPIVAVKSGRSAAGARAAASHTGALLAASDVTVDALFAPCGRDPHRDRRRADRRRGAACRPAAAAWRPGGDRDQRRRTRHRLRGRLRRGRPACRAARGARAPAAAADTCPITPRSATRST